MTKREDVGHRLRKLVLDLLTEAHGKSAVVYRTFGGEVVEPSLAVPSYPEPADPLQAIELAGYLERVAGGMVSRYAEAARGAGTSWRELAAVLDIDPDSDEKDHEAFLLVSARPSQPYDERYAHWRCASCGQYIRDLGPYGGHPDDCERGHAEGCERHRAEIAAYEARWEDD